MNRFETLNNGSATRLVRQKCRYLTRKMGWKQSKLCNETEWRLYHERHNWKTCLLGISTSSGDATNWCNKNFQLQFFFGYHIFRQTYWRTATKVSLLSETTCQNDAAKRMIWTPGFAVSLGGGIFRLAVPSIASRWESIFCWRFSQPHVRDEYGWLHLVMLIKPSAFTGWFPSSVT